MVQLNVLLICFNEKEEMKPTGKMFAFSRIDMHIVSNHINHHCFVDM